MTAKELAAYVRFMTRTNSTTFEDADILALMKVRQDGLAKEIMKADEDILLIPQYADLVENQREYPLPSDILSRIKRVEAKLDGTNWVPLMEIDITLISYPIVTETNITDVFNNSQVDEGNPYGARFDILRKAVKIYSGTIIDVTDGLQTWCNTWPTAVTDLTSETGLEVDPSTTTHGIPRELHEIWSRGVIIDWKSSREKPIPLDERELSYKDDRDEAIESLKQGNLDREVIGHLPPSSDRGEEGANY